jgi:hypothetical protein
MKKILSLILSVLIVAPVFGYDEDRAKGLTMIKSKMENVLQNLQSNKTVDGSRGYGDTTYKTLSKLKAKLDTDYFNKTLATDYTKSKIMTMLAQLAITAAHSIGTAAQGEQATLIQTTGSSLQASKDPQYQAIGSQFITLAGQISQGNDIEAQSTADSIKQYVTSEAPVISSDYKPSPQENALVSGLASVLSSSLSRILGMLSTFGIAALFKALGFGLLASNPIGLAVAILMQETIGAVATSITGNGQINWQPVENSAVSQVVGVTDKGTSAITNGTQNQLNGALQSITPIVQKDIDTKALSNSNQTGGTGVLPSGN